MSFEWKPEPQAEALVLSLLEAYKRDNSAIAQLERDLHLGTSTRLFDWLDYVVTTPDQEEELKQRGFVAVGDVYHHPGAQLPRVQIATKRGIAVLVDHIADFLMVRGMHREIEGSLLGGFRRTLIHEENQVALWVVERRGTLTMQPKEEPQAAENYLKAKEIWKSRARDNLDSTLLLADKVVDILGKDLAAHVILEVEREYWQSRNRAAQIQKGRQDRFGMGWANHDHHTFRSSRRHFVTIIQLFEKLGFHCRERFNPGVGAGWGAQVLENPRCRLVLFIDTDMLPEEHGMDIAHQPLSELERLGTVGLWCALHGDSILKAGMHHVEAQFEFSQLKDDLKKLNVRVMEPFSDLQFLKQAFTEGEIWPVNPNTLDDLLKQGKITAAQAQKFRNEGAVGSHLENLQRREGYKGFNQQNISNIISRTDPRTYNA